MTGGQPAPLAPAAAPVLTHVFTELVAIGPAIDGGTTARGARRMIEILGGRFEGPALRGEVLPGGWDWQLVRADGCIEVKADYMLRTDDGVLINVVNLGVIAPPAPGQPPIPVRTHPSFEAPLGRYDWLSRHAFVGTLDLATTADGQNAVKISFFRLD